MRSRKIITMAGSLLALILITADQFTKYLAESRLAGTSGICVIPGVFEFYYLENTGAAFGVLNNRQLFFIVIALIITILAIYVYLKTPTDSRFYPLRIVCILITAGAIGNMIDRLIRGYVIDFLYFSLIDFPIFNLADCYVCIGAGLMLIFIFTIYRSEEFPFLKR